ncbi:MAG: LysE family transporter [Chloroflexi bacterium]|nr:LysE family transporter [Chloroflexota bacterium]
MDIFLQGLLIGFGIAAPVGPIGLLCIRRTLSDGRVNGLLSGMGAATADAFYGTVAAFGLTFVSGFLTSQQTALRLVGGLFLCWLGWRTFVSAPAERAATAKGAGLLGAYTSTLFLTLTNPMTIASFTIIFAGMGIASAGGDYGRAALLVLGVFSGSAAWWLLLSFGVGLARDRFTPAAMQWVNRIAGATIALFGVAALLSVAGTFLG